MFGEQRSSTGKARLKLHTVCLQSRQGMQQDIDTFAWFVSGDGHDQWHDGRPAECFGHRSTNEERRLRGIRHQPEPRFETVTLSDQASDRLVVDENDARSEGVA